MNPHWSERREGGGRFALWLIRSIGLGMGRPLARLLLYPITLYFFFRRGPVDPRREYHRHLMRSGPVRNKPPNEKIDHLTARGPARGVGHDEENGLAILHDLVESFRADR